MSPTRQQQTQSITAAVDEAWKQRAAKNIYCSLYTCRPDLVGFVNGLALAVIKLKKPGVPCLVESKVDREQPAENTELLPRSVVEWASQHSDEIACWAIEIEETKNLIIEPQKLLEP